MKILIANISLLPSTESLFDSHDPYTNTRHSSTWDIGIAGDVIEFVRPHTTVPMGAGGRERTPGSGAGEYDKVILGDGRLALPGLVNAHTHLGMTLLRGYGDDLPLMQWLEEKIWPIEAELSADDVYWASLLAIGEMFKAGVTTCGDMYFHMDATAKAIAESGMRASLSRGLQDIGGSGKQGLQEAAALCRNWHNSCRGRVTVMLGPHAPYTCSPEFLRQTFDKAQRLGIPLHIHVAETETEIQEAADNYKTTPLGLLEELGVLDGPVTAAHAVYFSPDDIQLALERDVRIIHCPGSNMKLGSGIAPLPDMLEAGLKIGLGTDSAASNNTLNLWEEMRLSSLIHKAENRNAKVVPAETSLTMATKGGADALHLNKVGKILPGWAADLILVDNKGLHWQPTSDLEASVVYAGGAQDVNLTMAAGRVVYEGGRLTTIDEDRLVYQVQKCAQRLGLC